MLESSKVCDFLMAKIRFWMLLETPIAWICSVLTNPCWKDWRKTLSLSVVLINSLDELYKTHQCDCRPGQQQKCRRSHGQDHVCESMEGCRGGVWCSFVKHLKRSDKISTGANTYYIRDNALRKTKLWTAESGKFQMLFWLLMMHVYTIRRGVLILYYLYITMFL